MCIFASVETMLIAKRQMKMRTTTTQTVLFASEHFAFMTIIGLYTGKSLECERLNAMLCFSFLFQFKRKLQLKAKRNSE